MSWIGYGDDRYLKLIPTVEKMTKAPDISTYKEEDKELAHKFYAILSPYLRGRCSSLVRAESENRDGFKLWYDLMHEFHPQTKQRTLSLAQTLASYPSFCEKRSMLENILNYETLVDQYEKSSGEKYPSDLQTWGGLGMMLTVPSAPNVATTVHWSSKRGYYRKITSVVLTC